MSTNGLLSFRNQFVDFSRRSFDSQSIPNNIPIIAPFWDDVNIRRFGNIFYRQSNDNASLDFATYLINYHRDNATFNFQPTNVFIATWARVAMFGGDDSVSIFNNRSLNFTITDSVVYI